MNMNEITSALEAMTRLSRYLMENVSKSEQLTDNQIAACRALLRSWQPGEALEEKDCRRYGDKAYRCRQAHTAQAGWEPDKAASLWSATSDPAEPWPEWSQPIGAHDAYSAGDHVSHNGKHWTSDTDNNVWEPGTYGWTEAEE